MKLKDVWEKLGGVRENFGEGSGNHEKFNKNWEKLGKFRKFYFKMREVWEELGEVTENVCEVWVISLSFFSLLFFPFFLEMKNWLPKITEDHWGSPDHRQLSTCDLNVQDCLHLGWRSENLISDSDSDQQKRSISDSDADSGKIFKV